MKNNRQKNCFFSNFISVCCCFLTSRQDGARQKTFFPKFDETIEQNCEVSTPKHAPDVGDHINMVFIRY